MKLHKIVNVYDYSSKGICFYVMIKLNQYIGCKNQCYSKQSMLKSKFNCPLKTRLSLVNLLPNKMWFNYVLQTILLTRMELLCHLFIYLFICFLQMSMHESCFLHDLTAYWVPSWGSYPGQQQQFYYPSYYPTPWNPASYWAKEFYDEVFDQNVKRASMFNLYRKLYIYFASKE